MTAAMRDHPEMAHMMTAGTAMAGKMQGHSSMTAAMRDHPEMAHMMTARGHHGG